jgi:hypothetical protein
MKQKRFKSLYFEGELALKSNRKSGSFGEDIEKMLVKKLKTLGYVQIMMQRVYERR